MALGIVHDIAPGVRPNNSASYLEQWKAYSRGGLPTGIKYFAIGYNARYIIATTGTTDSCYYCLYNGSDANLSNWAPFSLPGPARQILSMDYHYTYDDGTGQGSFITTMYRATSTERPFYYNINSSSNPTQGSLWTLYMGFAATNALEQGVLTSVRYGPIFVESIAPNTPGRGAGWQAGSIPYGDSVRAVNRAATRNQSVASAAMNSRMRVHSAVDEQDAAINGQVTVVDGTTSPTGWWYMPLPGATTNDYGFAVRSLQSPNIFVVIGRTTPTMPNQIWYSSGGTPPISWTQGTVSFHPMDPNKSFGMQMYQMTNEAQVYVFERNGTYCVHCDGPNGGLLVSTNGRDWRKIFNPYNINIGTMASQPSVDTNGVAYSYGNKFIIISNNYIYATTSPT